jgi:hypothetical protein
MRQRRLKFRLTSGERGGIIKMLDLFRAVRLNDDQLEPDAAGRRPRFASDKCALPFVKPDHRASLSRPRSLSRRSAERGGGRRATADF